VIRSQQFILSRIDARNGAFGIVSDFLDGAVVSNDFPTFHVDAQRLLPDYLGWLSRTHGFVDLCRAASEGTTNRVRLKEDRFLSTTIQLPPLDEQQRIVAWVDELAAKIEEARGLRHDATKQIDSLVVAMAHRNDLDEVAKRQQGWTRVELRDVVTLVQEKHAVNPEVVYPNLGIYSFGRGLFPKPPIQGMATSATSLNRVHAGHYSAPRSCGSWF